MCTGVMAAPAAALPLRRQVDSTMGDDLRWKPVALVADGIGHAAALKPQAADQKLP
jgi:hypothetical protein